MKQWMILMLMVGVLACQDDQLAVSSSGSENSEEGGESADEGGESSEEGGESSEEGGESSEEGGESSEEGGESAEEGGESSGEGGETVTIELEPGSENPELEHPPLDLPPVSAFASRMTIGMLESSLPIVAGNDVNGVPINWTVNVQGSEMIGWEYGAFGGTLGRPDYVKVTAESMEPDMLYLKFMGDMANQVCQKILEADKEKSTDADRVMTPYVSIDAPGDATALDQNLAYLKLRFHGVKVDSGDPEALNSLRDLYLGGSAGPGSELDKAIAGWKSVCVGLLLSPEFHVY